MSERAMQELALLVLTALADAPRHGYAVAQEIKGITDGRVTPRTGALYGALDRLVTEGLITVVQEEVVDGRARRVFALTPEGRERLAVETERLAVAVHEARRRLGLDDAPVTA
ncbi:PadR family transcriptional regulator [Streptomyces sp. NPDC088789]|uniref:PadR family transcriptional regulator n=1 Tax=Streptomyces sp. NPDC088789 TaxID=3365899 RepID=UPI003824A64C